MNGASGRCAAASVRGNGAGSATPQHPGTEARCVKGTARTLRTAQMGCARKVRPFSLPGITIIIVMVFFPHHYHTLAVTWQVITGMFKQEVLCGGKGGGIHTVG